MKDWPILLEPSELIRQIEAYGFRMYVGDDGVVHGKPVKPGTSVPWEMRPLLDQLQMQNEAVAELNSTRDQDPEEITLKDLTQEEALPWLELVKAGQYRLVGSVTYKQSTQTASFTLKKTENAG